MTTAPPITQAPINLISSSIEDLQVSRLDEVSGASSHDSRFVGYLGLWSSFENGVRQNTKSVDWNQHRNVLQVLPQHPNAVHHEHYLCGNEGSMSARLIQNILQPLTAVSKELRQGIEWGDSKVSTEGMADKHDIPDFIAVKNGNQLRLVGEAKTPWAHRLDSDVARVAQSGDLWRKFGQIAIYMQKYGVKYGFYTTYKHTLFLKQERRGDRWILWHSRPIAAEKASIGIHENLVDLVDKVSVRECFLYLQARISSDDWRAKHSFRPWIVLKRTGNIDFGKYYDNDSPDAIPKASIPPVPSLPAQYAPKDSSGHTPASAPAIKLDLRGHPRPRCDPTSTNKHRAQIKSSVHEKPGQDSSHRVTALKDSSRHSPASAPATKLDLRGDPRPRSDPTSADKHRAQMKSSVHEKPGRDSSHRITAPAQKISSKSHSRDDVKKQERERAPHPAYGTLPYRPRAEAERHGQEKQSPRTEAKGRLGAHHTHGPRITRDDRQPRRVEK